MEIEGSGDLETPESATFQAFFFPQKIREKIIFYFSLEISFLLEFLCFLKRNRWSKDRWERDLMVWEDEGMCLPIGSKISLMIGVTISSISLNENSWIDLFSFS